MRVPETPTIAGKSNITLSIIFHSLMIVAFVFLAAREGILGEKFKEIAVVIVPKQEKKPDEKPKEPEKPVEPSKVEEKKPEATQAAPPPAAKQETAGAEVEPARVVLADAPPPAAIPADFHFSDGARAVQTSSDPNEVYQSSLEYTLHSRWSCPRNMEDPAIFSEVEVSVDAQGRVSVQNWKQLSGNSDWDASVRRVFDSGMALRQPPPKSFPPRVLVRFDLVSRQLTSLN